MNEEKGGAGLKPALALCIGALALLTSCVPHPTPRLYEPWEVLLQLRNTYGIDFVLLSVEPYDEAFVIKGRHYTAAPAENRAFSFDVYDAAKNQNPGPIPVIFPQKYHQFKDHFLDASLRHSLTQFCAGAALPFEAETLTITLPEEGWEDKIALLGAMIARLNQEFPFSTSATPHETSNLQIQREVLPGIFARARANCYQWDTGCYALDVQETTEKLRENGERNAAAATLGRAFQEFLAGTDLLSDCTMSTEDPYFPEYSFLILLPDAQEMERALPLLDAFFAAQAPQYQAPGAGAASGQFSVRFRTAEESRTQVYFTPFQKESPYLHFDAEALRQELCATLFPISQGNSTGGQRFISGDRITIDGDQLIVERGDEILVIDSGHQAGSTP